MASELGIPVLALVQLNRNRATRADKRPQLADLRESGDLENTADSVLGLYRDEMDNPQLLGRARVANEILGRMFFRRQGVPEFDDISKCS